MMKNFQYVLEESNGDDRYKLYVLKQQRYIVTSFCNNFIVKNDLERHSSRENMLIDFIYGLFSDADLKLNLFSLRLFLRLA